MPRKHAPDIRASGAVVWRTRKRKVEIAVVHRPRYDDWSLPKGKVEPGETDLAAAVREVREETGAQVTVSRRLDQITYDVKDGRKQVSYWLARHVGGEFTGGDEVDELRWLTLGEARSQVTRPAEAALIGELKRLPLPEAVVVLIRHAKAGRRAEWDGPDNDRPLDETGRLQAARLAEFVQPFAPTAVVSAEPLRCVQTVTPAADRLGLQVRIDPSFGDAGFAAAPAVTEQALTNLARHGAVTVVASQGTAVPGVLERLWPRRRPTPTGKGTAWVISFVDGGVLSADHYPDAAR